MTLRPTLFSRWLAQPAELLQRTTPRATRQALVPSQSTSSTRTITTRRPFSSLPIRFNSRPSPRPRTAPAQARLPSRTARRAYTSNAQSTQPPKQGVSLSERLRTLSREYGWAAVGVYLGLSALDFPFCFLAVRLLGVDRIGHWEHVAVSTVKDAVRSVWPQGAKDVEEKKNGLKGKESNEENGVPAQAAQEEQESAEEASIWTQLALAYAVHKSLIFIRVPLTAAVTPKIVKVLRRWGWDIGKRKPKST